MANTVIRPGPEGARAVQDSLAESNTWATPAMAQVFRLSLAIKLEHVLMRPKRCGERDVLNSTDDMEGEGLAGLSRIATMSSSMRYRAWGEISIELGVRSLSSLMRSLSSLG